MRQKLYCPRTKKNYVLEAYKMVTILLFHVSRSQNDTSRIVRCPKICSELTPTDMIVWGEIIVLKSKPQIYKPKALPHRPKNKWSQDKNLLSCHSRTVPQRGKQVPQRKKLRLIDQEREQNRWFFPLTANKCLETRNAGPEGKQCPWEDIKVCEVKTNYFCLDHQM